MKRILWALLVVLSLCGCGARPLLQDVTLTPITITPNADGRDDSAQLRFRLNQTAQVSIVLEDAAGRRYTFRPPARVTAQSVPYTLDFRGVVEGYALPGETPPEYHVLTRALQDGDYTWFLTAAPESGAPVTISGTLTVRDADARLPGIHGFSASPRVFSPNQDGIADRVTINLVLEKDVRDLQVYLKSGDGVSHYIPESEKRTLPNAQGFHTFDYDGGIDMGGEPPTDGAYTIYAEAWDRLGQHVLVTDTLSIVSAGLPMAYIRNATVDYTAATLRLDDTLCFSLTVENDSATYIRTTGPWPGVTYRTTENFNTLNYSEESGVFRVGLDFENSLRNYPFRWGIGRPGVDLVQIDDYWYLPPLASSHVTGCVQIVEAPPDNPYYFWTGLIHEDVEIAAVNNRVDPYQVTLLP